MSYKTKTGAILVKKSPMPTTTGRGARTSRPGVDSPLRAYNQALETLKENVGTWYLIWKQPATFKKTSYQAYFYRKVRAIAKEFTVETRVRHTDGTDGLYVRLLRA